MIRIASGADANDVAFAIIYGPATMTDIQPNISEVRQDSNDVPSHGKPDLKSVQLAA